MPRTLTTIENNDRPDPKATKPKRVRAAARMSDITDIYGGKVRIFRTTHSGDVYQMRMWIAEEQKYVRRTLKTRDKTAALKLAEDEFIIYKAKVLNGEKLFSLTADELRERYLKYSKERVEGNQISAGRFSNIRTFTKHYLQFVGKTARIQNIPKLSFRNYRAFRQKTLPSITMTVVRNEAITISQMYGWAVEQGYLAQTQFPDFGEIKVPRDEVRRKGYSVIEYKQIIDIAKFWYQKVPKNHPERDKEIYYRRSVRDFIVIMANCGLRTGELLNLRFREVALHGDKTATVTILRDTTKVRKERGIRVRRGDIFGRRKEYSPFSAPNHFVFSDFDKERQIPKDILYEYYRALMLEVKAKYPDFDAKKTAYSLRHFFITVQLSAGQVSPYKIARYTGTSLQQIQDHYDGLKDLEISNEIIKQRISFKAEEDEVVSLAGDLKED